MTTTDTAVNDLIINRLTQAEYDTITPNANELYIVTDGSISSSDVINALGYTPVDKAGDTMTGSLYIDTDQPTVNLNDTIEVAGTTPSSDRLKALIFRDKNGTGVGRIQNMYLSTGARRTLISSSNAAATESAVMYIGYDANGNVETYAPHPSSSSNSNNIATTKWVKDFGYVTADDIDGNWTPTSLQAVSAISINYASDYNISLANYLPNDNNLYEIDITARANSTATSGQETPIILSVGGYTPEILVTYVKSTGVQNYGYGYCKIYAKYDTTFKLKRSTDYRGTADIWLLGYRKVK